MTRPRPARERDRTGHHDECHRPFIEWCQVLGNAVGTCDACNAVFTRRRDWSEGNR